MQEWDDEQFQVFENNGGYTLPIPRVVEMEETKVVQIYTKTQNGYSSIVVADKDRVYKNEVLATDKMSAIMRGASYVKNMLPYTDRVDLFADVQLYEIQMNRYLNRMRLPIELNNEKNRCQKLTQLCDRGLVDIKLRLMQAFNRGER
ncbi:MAG: hypothetical protein KBT03_13660 [Bacteroidales bacterium]|nr:hypothetical protein [Candidatus Scybalousia scybalohippi]